MSILATGWHTKKNLNSTTKALKIDLILEPEATEDELELMG